MVSTPELGAEVFASDLGEQIFCHTCKSRACSSCGYRTTMQWQSAGPLLPSVSYKGTPFIMLDRLWPCRADQFPRSPANLIGWLPRHER